MGAEGDLYYSLVLSEDKAFDFTALFYDSTYGAAHGGLAADDIALEVRLLGGSTDDEWHKITVAQMEIGTFLTWHVIVYTEDIGKSLILDVKYVRDDDTLVAGFFLDDVQPAGNTPPIPEPATVGLVLFGLAGIFARRKRA